MNILSIHRICEF